MGIGMTVKVQGFKSIDPEFRGHTGEVVGRFRDWLMVRLASTTIGFKESELIVLG